ncbi:MULTISPECIES: hypothetical protein [unclassified Nocardiopsis]|uniref:hypothetical protein n=1 Tax=unclassified Nocardiopsis TaxID=2649073 RepID=UPI0013590705|nr:MULTISPECIES: hypothetical protein [unclassified Nocardiopsis]
MSVITEVMKRTGATRADVIRVAREGGTTTADWDIAVAIEQAGGRKAADMMLQPERVWRAEHERLQHALWEETRPEDVDFLREKASAAGITDITPLLPAVTEPANDEPSAPTNPHAVYDPEVRIYGEPTAPDAPQTVLPDHPSEEPEDDTPAARSDRHQVRVWAGIAGLTGATKDTVDRLVQRWATPHALRRGLTGLLRRAAERGSERRRARAQYLLTTYDIAA